MPLVVDSDVQLVLLLLERRCVPPRNLRHGTRDVIGRDIPGRGTDWLSMRNQVGYWDASARDGESLSRLDASQDLGTPVAELALADDGHAPNLAPSCYTGMRSAALPHAPGRASR